MVHFRGPGRSLLAGVEVGNGPTGVVLAHQSDGSHCDWWPYAPELVGLGYRVLAFDFDGYGASSSGNSNYPRDVAAAARELRALGAQRVVLMGASMGGTAVVCAAPRLDPPPAGVVDLSGPSSFEGMDAVAAARSLRAPALFAEGNQDPIADVAPVQAAAASTDKPLVVADTSLHGVALLDPDTGSPQVRDAVRSFLLRVAPPH
ncbi:MAG: alpha/beta hydrolase [Candidatus Dormibacteraeota bacterium]|nr:alpha/beta hydrolase [Candidatus Dormibacteraeota bacterium]